MMTHNANVGQLLHLNLRRDWLKLALWLLGLVGLMGGAAAKSNGLYGTQTAMRSIITTLKTPAMVSLLGPFTAAQPYTVAGIYAAEMMVFTGLFVAMMNIYFAIHATRQDEDSGLVELVRAHATGRNAPLTAAILELLLLNLTAGILEALSLQVSGMHGMTAAGNWLFGAGLAAFGLMFGAFSLLWAQLADTSRDATMMSYVWLGSLFIARMATDVQAPAATWLTVYGWIEKLDIYATDQWLPVGLMLAVTVVLGVLTLAVTQNRDVGAGLLPQRKGRQSASVWLNSPLALIARLERTSTLIWLFGLGILGATYGSIFGTAGDLLTSNPTMAKLIGTAATHAANRTIVLAFTNKLAVIFVILATLPGLSTLLRINADERKGYFEALHARNVSRTRLYASIAVYGLLVAVLAFFCGMVGMIAAGQAVMPHAPTVSHLMRAFWGYVPALIVVYGLGACLVGLLPRWQSVIWIWPAYGFFSLYLGSLLDLPQWATRLTPYGWINNVPVAQVQWPTAAWMTLLGLGLILCGGCVYANRDLMVN